VTSVPEEEKEQTAVMNGKPVSLLFINRGVTSCQIIIILCMYIKFVGTRTSDEAVSSVFVRSYYKSSLLDLAATLG
jgi:hypothetical protein